jgi:hypothetical protein
LGAREHFILNCLNLRPRGHSIVALLGCLDPDSLFCD